MAHDDSAGRSLSAAAKSSLGFDRQGSLGSELTVPNIDLEGVQIDGWMFPLASHKAPWELPLPTAHSCFFGILEGQCRHAVGRNTGASRLSAGDFLIVKQGTGGRLVDDGDAECIEAADSAANDCLVNAGRNTKTQLIGGGFTPRDGGSATLLASLPPLVVIDGQDGKFVPWVGQLLQLLRAEFTGDVPETRDVVNRLIGILFIKSIRHALAASEAGAARLFSELIDADIAAALRRLHERPNHPWTVAALAGEVGLSRSTFAARFLVAVGKPPLHYLRDLRMQTAGLLLREGRLGLKQIAATIGYRTPSAFSVAFKRWAGTSPGEYRQSLPTTGGGASSN